VQFVADLGREPALLAAARWSEQVLGFGFPTPPE
jgi:hypothetical protein